FLNAELLAYCEREHLTFTRSRAYKKNDQCYGEQKNSAVVRPFVGYDSGYGRGRLSPADRIVARVAPLRQLLPALHEADGKAAGRAQHVPDRAQSRRARWLRR